jgi:hypothetical protein
LKEYQMAGEWIKWVKGLQDKPEVFRMASALSLDRFSVAARLMLVWSWADDNVRDKTVDENGCAFVALGPSQGSLIDAVSGVAGFADSMTAVGWLVQRNGSLVFPNFNRHNGETAKQRALTAKRMQKSRANNAPEEVAETLRNERNKSATRGEKSRGEVTPNGVKDPPTPLPFASAAFADAWAKWVQHRKEKRAKLTPTSIKQQFADFTSWGEERSIAAILHSVKKGWTGIFEPEGAGTKSQPPRRETRDEINNRQIAELLARDAQQGKDNNDAR